MPIYEFYCPDCHTVYSFFSSTVDTEAKPACPKCGRPELGRRPSRFATLKPGRGEESEAEGDDPFAGLDEERMERAVEALAGEFEGMDDDADPDPRQLSRVLRKFGELTGLDAGPRLKEMLARLESGEDPEALESELGDDSDEDLSDFFAVRKKMLGTRPVRPRVDETLHFL